ncbi:MAG: transporter permease [Anaerocolumna sp.]|jgi:multidrug/hemolysin transport system permease protein|nr:transporter permease [Anaerocolumna sp.]
MTLIRLVKRNILVYSRDRANIFFSLLSTLIIIGLMVVFLGNMNANNVVDLLKEYGGTRNEALDRTNAEQLVIMWTLAGIVVVNSVTITLAMVGIMVEDEDQKRLSSFYVSPLNRGLFVLGYIIAAIIMGIIMCTLTVAIAEGYVLFTGGNILSVSQVGKVFLLIILTVFSSACMVFLLANFVHSTSSFSGLSTVVGTLVGFLSAIYLPMGMLPNKVQTVLKCFPLLHGCSLMRNELTKEALSETFKNCPAELIDGYREYMGMTINWKNTVINDNIKVAVLLISGIIFIIIAAIMQKNRKSVNR